MKPVFAALLSASALLVAACGGASGSLDSAGLPTPATPVARNDCKADFTPDRVAAGEDCDPDLNRAMFCPLIPGTQYLRSRTQIIECDGVSVSEHMASGGEFSADYLAIQPSSGTRPSAIYLGLHYLGATAEYFANLTRLAELAKARNVLVLVPQAPNLEGVEIPVVNLPITVPIVGENGLSRWPTAVTDNVESYLQLLDAVVADARGRFGAGSVPLYAAGLSNGAPMALFYACGRAGHVDAVLSVAGSQSNGSLAACAPSTGVGVVLIHGDLDLVTPYAGVPGVSAGIAQIYQQFRRLNQCPDGDMQTVLQDNGGRVTIDYTRPCRNQKRVVLATSNGNGHNWPGDDSGAIVGLEVPVGPFGPARNDIDATIQGFDLLRYAGAN